MELDQLSFTSDIAKWPRSLNISKPMKRPIGFSSRNSLIVYGVWHAAPFAFVIFYAGLQTLPADQLEAAQIDGATRTQQVRYVVLPHLMPLVSFVALIQLMDNFRVFEPIVGFNASAHAQSLSWFIFNDLGGETRQLSSASATSVLTIIGVTILLLPVLRRTWRDFMEKAK